jgi:hypothetical protein
VAESFAHKWGQTIGTALQSSLREVFQEVADRHGLYLDYQRERPARAVQGGRKRGGVKLSWLDRYGNTHDLDYVMERSGTDDVIGLPAAFIEVAWRRYTKHSKNKAQEIEGAVIALADTYNHVRPFLGIVLAGVFTARALAQLRSRNFTVAYIPYQDILQAFAGVGIDASFTESTPEKEFRKKIKQFEALSPEQFEQLKKDLLYPQRQGGQPNLPSDKPPMAEFLEALDRSLTRNVIGFTVIVLHGQAQQLPTAADAVAYIQSYPGAGASKAPPLKYEIDVRYNNGDVIHGVFQQ